MRKFILHDLVCSNIFNVKKTHFPAQREIQEILLLEVGYPRWQLVLGSMANAWHAAGVFNNIQPELVGYNTVVAWSNAV